MDVAILYSIPTHRGQSSDFVITDADTESSAKKIAQALEKSVSIQLFPIREDTIDTISDIRTDIFLDLIEWDGLDLPLSLKAIDVIEATGIPYTGAMKKNYKLTTDKLLMKKAFDTHDLPTARWQPFYTGNEIVRSDFHYPVILKLSQSHCSVGLDTDAVVSDKIELQNRIGEKIRVFHQPVIAEEFIDGREFQVTMLERAAGLTMLPIAEIFFDETGKNTFLTFDSRWTPGATDYKTSHIKLAKFDMNLTTKMEKVCLRAFHELEFRDYARFDMRFRVQNNAYQIFFLETNANPGLDDDDAYGLTLSFKAAGMAFRDFLLEIIASALRRSDH